MVFVGHHAQRALWDDTLLGQTGRAIREFSRLSAPQLATQPLSPFTSVNFTICPVYQPYLFLY